MDEERARLIAQLLEGGGQPTRYTPGGFSTPPVRDPYAGMFPFSKFRYDQPEELQNLGVRQLMEMGLVDYGDPNAYLSQEEIAYMNTPGGVAQPPEDGLFAPAPPQQALPWWMTQPNPELPPSMGIASPAKDAWLATHSHRSPEAEARLRELGATWQQWLPQNMAEMEKLRRAGNLPPVPSPYGDLMPYQWNIGDDAQVAMDDMAVPEGAQRAAQTAARWSGLEDAAMGLQTGAPVALGLTMLNAMPLPLPASGALGKVDDAARLAKGVANSADDVARRAARMADAADVAQGTRMADVLSGPVTDLQGAFRPNVPVERGNVRGAILQLQDQMTPELRAKLAKVRDANPELRGTLDYMHPVELQGVISSSQSIEKTKRLLEVLPQAQEYAALAKAGAAKRGWYRASTQAIIDVFGPEDAPRFAALLAALSPQNGVPVNLQNALEMWGNWTRAGRPTDPTTIKALLGQSVVGQRGEKSVLEAWRKNSIRALATEDPRMLLRLTLSGPKVDSFMRNLGDDVLRVTNDTWMANVSHIPQEVFRRSLDDAKVLAGNPGMTPEYALSAARQREGGDLIGYLPAEVQETGWVFGKGAYEGAEKRGIPIRDTLGTDIVSTEALRDVPDFSTLFHDPKYADILQRGGYEDQLSRLQPYVWPDAVPSLSSSEQRSLDKIMANLQEVAQDRTGMRTYHQGITLDRPDLTAVTMGETKPGAPGWQLSGTEGQQLAAQKRVRDATIDINRRSIPQQAFGLQALPDYNRAGVGDYQGQAGQPVWGSRAVLRRQGQGALPGDEQALMASNLFTQYFTGQDANPHMIPVMDPQGPGIQGMMRDVKAEPRAAMMSDLLSRQPRPDIIADPGGDVLMKNFGDVPMSEAQMQSIREALPDQQLRPFRDVADPNKAYVETQYGPEGGRVATEQILAAIDAMPKNKQQMLRRWEPQLQRMVADLLQEYKGPLWQLRPDQMRALETFVARGFAGLRDPNVALPAIIAIGGGPLLMQMLQQEENQI